MARRRAERIAWPACGPGRSSLAVRRGGGARGVRADGDAPGDAGRRRAPREGRRDVGAARWPDQARYTLDLAYDARRFTLVGHRADRVPQRERGRRCTSVWLRVWANAFGGCRGEPRARDDPRAAARSVRAGATARRSRSASPRPLAPGATSAESRLQIRVTAPTRPDRFGRFHGAGVLRQRDPDPRRRRRARRPASAVHVRGRELLLADLVVARAAARAGGPAGRLDRHAGRAAATRPARSRSSPRGRATSCSSSGASPSAPRRAGPVRLRRFSIPGTPARAGAAHAARPPR